MSEKKDTELKLMDEIKRKISTSQDAVNSYYYSYESDIFARLVIDKLKLTPIKAALAGFIVTLLFYISGFLIHFLTQKDVAGLGINQIYFDFIYDFLIVTNVYFFYCWIHIKPQELFFRLQLRIRNTEHIKSFIENYITKYINIPFWSHLAIIGALCLVVFIEVSSFSETSFLWGTDKAFFWLLRLYKVPVVWGIGYYMIIVVFIKQIITVWGIRKLIKKSDILHHASIEQEKAILKLISDYCMKFVYFIGICGIGYVFLVTRSITFEYFELDILVNYSFIFYIFVSLFFFFYPLHPFLEILKEHFKKQQLSELKALLRIAYQPIATFLIAIFTPIVVYNGLF